MNEQKNDCVEQRASEWFVLMTRGSPTQSDRKAFHAWLQLKSEHEKAYREYEQLWLLMADLKAIDYGSDLDPSQTQRASFSEKCLNLFSFCFYWRQPAIPVMMVVALFSVGLLFFFASPADDEYERYQTLAGEVTGVTLDDGSVVTLSGDTRLSYLSSDSSRTVRIDSGQAYFDVTTAYDRSGRKKPFVVVLGEASVEVLGTEFDINLYENAAMVTVSEGAVSVKSSFNAQIEYTLKAGQQVIAVGDRYERLMEPVKVDVKSETSWREGRLIYRNAKLERVIQDVNRFHSGKFVFSEEALEAMRITTSFNLNQITEMAYMLESILPVKVVKNGEDQYLIEYNRKEQ